MCNSIRGVNSRKCYKRIAMVHVFDLVGTLTPERTGEVAERLASVLARAQGQDLIVLYIDSVGGAVSGVKELATMIAEASVPTVAVVGDVCASAAYWIASQCSQIWAISPTARIGSVGGLVTYTKPSKMAVEMFGEEVTIYAPQSTRKNEEFRALESGNTEPIQKSILEPLTALFIGDVFRGREGRLIDPQDASLSSGVALYASEALGRGWIDKILGTRLALRSELGMLLNHQTDNTQMGVNLDAKQEAADELSVVALQENTTTHEQENNVQGEQAQPEQQDDAHTLNDRLDSLERDLAALRSLLNKQSGGTADSSTTVEEAVPPSKNGENGGSDAPPPPDPDEEIDLDAEQVSENVTLQVAPVSGVGAMVAKNALVAFAEQHANDPLAIIERLKQEQC